MSDFEQTLTRYRLVETHHGDDLQAVAHREMGDANRWPELVWINSLTWPYITDDPRRVADGVLLSGSLLKVPAPTAQYTDGSEYGQVFERDVAVVDKKIQTANGDLAVFAGVDNLKQQLSHRISTPKGQARRHPEYGCLVWRLQGRVNGPLAAKLGADYVQSALEADYRVEQVDASTASVQFDALKVTAQARAIQGGVVDIEAGS